MPLNQQEIAHSHGTTKFLEEGVLAGIGVLLVFLGVFSKVPLTNILAVGIGAFVFYTALELFRSKRLGSSTANDDSMEQEGEEDSVDRYFEEKQSKETTITAKPERSV